MFVDECTFESSPRHRAKTRRSSDENGPFFNYVRRSGRVSLAVFGGICGNGVLPLSIIPGSFTAEVYRDLLESPYWPVLQKKFPNQSFRYVQDNCPAHKRKVVQEWLAEVPQLCDATLCLPPYSNDLNPIEHVWYQIKAALNGKIFCTKDELSHAVLAEWERFGAVGRVQSLTSSVHRRVNAVIAASAGVRHTARFCAFYGTRKAREGTLFLLLCLLVLFGALCATRVFFCAKNQGKAHVWHTRHEFPEGAQKGTRVFE